MTEPSGGQASLFDQLPDPGDNRLGFFHAPASGAPDTERLAAVLVYPRTGTKRLEVLDHFVQVGEGGATDEEVSEALGMRLYTAAPRRHELVSDGWLEDSGRTRRTTTRTPATVWVLTDAGRAQWPLIRRPVSTPR